MIKPRLLILSDLFGGKSSDWVNQYIELLRSKFDIQYYDVLELGGVATADNEENNIHNQFLNGGIDKAVKTLLDKESEEVSVLGFSIGGTIAWKAALKGLKVVQLIAVSSTRLRFETQTPNSKIKLYFGEEDLNKPDSQWFLDLKISNQIFENEKHQLYLEKKNVLLICNAILLDLV
ncbi:alpha/beta hydrolase [Flavobacterium poyangense]|uniref:alpha/beta hydrolase n=1 Tax=Flavobacterium poyangense TaxID=2204302 RepID=UPI0014229C45|nr:alpha/beta hydrolase [Flavobacterium sp. JXAS1]